MELRIDERKVQIKTGEKGNPEGKIEKRYSASEAITVLGNEADMQDNKEVRDEKTK